MCASAALLVLANLISCTTVKTKSAEEHLTEKPFKAEALSAVIFVEHKGKSYRVKSEINILEDAAIRMDLLTGLDLPLASLLLTKDKVEYLLYRDRKYYRGQPNPNALDKLFPLAVEARTLTRIIQQQKNPGDICKTEAKDADVLSCTNSTDGVEYTVSWTQHQNSGLWSGRAKKMILEIPSKETKLKFHFNDLSVALQNKDQLMTLKIPPGFKTYSVPSR